MLRKLLGKDLDCLYAAEESLAAASEAGGNVKRRRVSEEQSENGDARQASGEQDERRSVASAADAESTNCESDSDDEGKAAGGILASILAGASSDSSSSDASSSDDEAPAKEKDKDEEAAEGGTPDATSGALVAADAGGAGAASSDAIGKEKPNAKPKPKPKVQQETADSDSESSGSSSSSSSSSSESSSEEEDEAMPTALAVISGEDKEPDLSVEIPKPEDAETKRKRDLEVVRSAHLRREELTNMLLELPEEVYEQAVLRSLVRLTVQSAEDATCVLAEVAGIEDAAPYSVTRANGDQMTIKVQLRCARGSSKRLFKVSHVSNQDVTEAEFDQWRKLTNRTGVDPDHLINQLKQQAEHIHAARSFVFNEAEVGKILRRKPNLEFLPQQEARMRSLMQCALTQMDISGVQDNEAKDLELRYKGALDNLNNLENKSAKQQDNWFERRPNLYSLKEINRKNFFRQQNRDRHALDYVMRTEAAGGGGLNPFERRACRPVCAWDTKLTGAEGQEDAAPAAPPKEAPPKALADKAASEPQINGVTRASPEQAAAAKPTEGEAKLSRVDSVLRAHRRFNLLAKLGTLQLA